MANHRVMCRFSSPNSERYKPIRQAVVELVLQSAKIPIAQRTRFGSTTAVPDIPAMRRESTAATTVGPAPSALSLPFLWRDTGSESQRADSVRGLAYDPPKLCRIDFAKSNTISISIKGLQKRLSVRGGQLNRQATRLELPAKLPLHDLDNVLISEGMITLYRYLIQSNKDFQVIRAALVSNSLEIRAQLPIPGMTFSRNRSQYHLGSHPSTLKICKLMSMRHWLPFFLAYFHALSNQISRPTRYILLK